MKLEIQIHTVYTTADKMRGVASGFDGTGTPIRIWLKSDRAVKRALSHVERFANTHALKCSVQPIKRDRRLVSAVAEWEFV